MRYRAFALIVYGSASAWRGIFDVCNTIAQGRPGERFLPAGKQLGHDGKAPLLMGAGSIWERKYGCVLAVNTFALVLVIAFYKVVGFVVDAISFVNLVPCPGTRRE